MAKTIIHRDNQSYFGEEEHLKVSQQKSFARMIFELLTERTGSEDELKLFELILNLSIDHGPDTPSAKVVIERAQKGESISESVSEGIEQINESHGGAAEPLMEEFYRIKNQESSSQEVVANYLNQKKRLPGFGHRIYKDVDPRAQLILSYVEKLPGGPDWINIGKEVEKELNTQSGKQLPLNIDGAIAVSFCALNLDPKLGKAIFIIARTPGLCGQYLNHT